MRAESNTHSHSVDRSPEELLREMGEKAEAERSQILEHARERAAAVAERNRGECARLEQEGLEAVERELSAERDRLLGEVRSEARANRLAFKREEIDRVFESARETVAQRIGGEGWEPALFALLEEAVGFVGPGARVVVAKADLAASRKWLAEHEPRCAAEGGPEPRGTVVATSADGRRRAENGMQSRLARAKGSVAAEIAKVLFGQR